ncbi:hypothetical protein PYCC9005_002512 [Savitreella phatthalungensis]
MPSHKAEKYRLQLETALAAHDFAAVPELCRKLRKHASANDLGSYADDAQAEASILSRVVKQGYCVRQATPADTVANASSHAGYLFVWPTLSEADVSEITKLLEAGSTPPKTPHAVFVRLLFLVTKRDAAGAAQLITTSPQASSDAAGITLAGVLAELQGDVERALTAYRSVALPSGVDASRSTRWWHELATYRRAILSNDDAAFAYFAQDTGISYPAARIHVLSQRPADPHYTRTLLANARFPSADEDSMPLLLGVQRTYDDFVARGSSVLEAENMVDLVHAAIDRSYHSPRLLRMLANLEDLLRRDRASDLALKAYIQVALHARRTQANTNPDTDSLETIVDALADHFRRIVLRYEGFENERIVLVADIAGWLDVVTKELGELDRRTATKASLLRSKLELYRARRGDWVTGLKHAQDVLESCDTHDTLAAEVAYRRAFLLAQQNQRTEAVMELRKSLEADPSSLKAYLSLANMFACGEEYERALVALRQVGALAGTTNKFEEQRLVHQALLAELDVLALEHGPQHALDCARSVVDRFVAVVGPISLPGVDSPAVHGITPQVNGAIAPTHLEPPIISLNDEKATAETQSVKPAPVVMNGTSEKAVEQVNGTTEPIQAADHAASVEPPVIVVSSAPPVASRDTIEAIPGSKIVESSDRASSRRLSNATSRHERRRSSTGTRPQDLQLRPTSEHPAMGNAASTTAGASTRVVSTSSSSSRTSSPHFHGFPLDRRKDLSIARSIQAYNSLRKSASMREFRSRIANNGRQDSRAVSGTSTLLNGGASFTNGVRSSTTVLPDISGITLAEDATDPATKAAIKRLSVLRTFEPRHDERVSPESIDAGRKRAMAADLWLAIASLARQVLELRPTHMSTANDILSGTDEPASSPHHQYKEVQEAISQARALTGGSDTPKTLVASARARIALYDRLNPPPADPTSHSPVSESDPFTPIATDAGVTSSLVKEALMELESGISIAGVGDESECVCVYAGLLVRLGRSAQDERYARAYALLESQVATPAANSNPTALYLAAHIAQTRNEIPRAKQLYWKAINAQDTAGIIDWRLLEII